MAGNFSRKDLWFLVLTTVAVIVVINMWIHNKLKEAERQPAQPAIVRTQATGQDEKFVHLQGEVIRKEHLDPGREYSHNLIYVDGEEVGRFKSSGEDIYDITGVFPEGAVKFTNLTKKTRGDEYFKKGKRHGEYNEYYEDGYIRMKKLYMNGKLLSEKEYFVDGRLRMEANYEDALIYSKTSEVGAGKVYFRNGTVMYEWNLTNANPNKYKKSYNIRGQPVEVKYYGENGELLSTKKFPR